MKWKEEAVLRVEYTNVLRLVALRRVDANVLGRLAALHLQEAVGGVADACRQNLFSQPGVYHGALSVAGSIYKAIFT